MDERKKEGVQEDDLIQSFIELYNDSGYKIEDITDEAFNVFADTLTYSYSTVMFCLYELADNPEIQEELIGEIRRYNKKNKKLTNENLEELLYLDAIIKETFRKYPPIATIIRSRNDKTNTDLVGYPDKNALVFQSVLGIHRDPQYYTKPELFDPDRFTEKRCFVKDSFIPFGFGTRSYLYFKFTTLQVKLILVSIFSSLGVDLKDGSSNTFKYNPKLLCLSPSEDLSLNFERI